MGTESCAVPPDLKKLIVPFHCPSNILICGETNCGKTVWLEKLLKYQDQLFEPRPKSVIVMYKQYQDTYSKWETEIPNVHCVQGLRKDLLEAGGLDRVLLVLDDWMAETVSDPFFCSLYTAGRHNGLCGIVTIWHQIFPPGKHQRTISLNQHSYVLMKSPRIRSQVPNLGSQLGIRSLLTDAYRQATAIPYGYLVADFSNKSDHDADKYAIRTMVFPDDNSPTQCFI